MQMTPKNIRVLISVGLFFAGLVIPFANAQQISEPIKAVQLMGLAGVKNNAEGTLSVENGKLHFVFGKGTSDINATAIQDVVTGTDSQAAISNTVYVLSLAAPYGSGRFLSLFRKKIDTVTVQYRDADGGLHGAIFLMAVGGADVIKRELVAQGARTSASAESSKGHASSNKLTNKEHKQ
jgi:hypothetical protein